MGNDGRRMDRRQFLIGGLAAGVAGLAGIGAGGLGRAAMAATGQQVEVFKTPTCGCCGDWIAHLEAAGFTVAARDLEHEELLDFKAAAGVTEEFASCHTALVEGYVIEGHVPAADIARLLEERPEALGLAVPGMPFGSPGMGPEDQRDAYDVILLGRDGGGSVFASYPAAA
jgi:hypothetical protein